MKIHTILFVYLLIITAPFSISAQTITSTVMDKKTNEPIPYATIQLSDDKGIITNEEGRFSIALENSTSPTDSIYISSMGYEKVAIAYTSISDSIIYITPKAIELQSAFVSNKNLSVDEIIDLVKEKLDQNYSRDLSKKRLFFRQSDFGKVKNFNIDFKKSTIKEFNKKFIDSILYILPKKSEYYTELLGDYSGNFEKQKLNIIKAAELYDKNNENSMEALGKKAEKIFKDNVKPDSYLKIKSGFLFGTKVQVDSILEQNKEAAQAKEEIEKENTDKKGEFLTSKKENLEYLFANMFFQEDSKLNFIHKSGRYDFELADYSAIDESSVYVINFTPGRRADFKGTIYVNTEDFAIMRVDYENVKVLKSFNLLGVSYKKTIYKGKTIFTKGSDQKYHVRYLEKTGGNYFRFDRPLKIIEKNKHVKGRRKQNELSLGIDISMTQGRTSEIVIFNHENITDAKYKSSAENKTVTPQYLSKYNPDFWQGYNIMEPNAAIRSFKVMEGE